MFKVNEQLMLKLLNYLATRPYKEVIYLINELQKLKKQKEEKK